MSSRSPRRPRSLKRRNCSSAPGQAPPHAARPPASRHRHPQRSSPAARRSERRTEVSADDRTLQTRLLDHLSAQPSGASVQDEHHRREQHDAYVRLMQNEDERQALRLAAESVPSMKKSRTIWPPSSTFPCDGAKGGTARLTSMLRQLVTRTQAVARWREPPPTLWFTEAAIAAWRAAPRATPSRQPHSRRWRS